MKKILLPLLTAIICCSCHSTSSFSMGRKSTKTLNSSGLYIDGKTDRYSLKNVVNTPIRTYEAWVDTYDTNANQGSTILANYTEGYNPGISFRIITYGQAVGCPQLNIRYDRDTQKQFTISTNICGTGKRHVAFTVSNTQVKGYLDGVLKKTWTFDGNIPTVDVPLSVGGDNRSGNTWWFRGTIYTIAAFSTVRTQQQINSDMQSISLSSNLLINFDFEHNGFTNTADLNNPLVPYLYEDNFTDSSSYDYTFAVVPDTQAIMYYYQDSFSDIYDFIINKKDDMKIKEVIGLGDITEQNIDSEWLVARENIYKLKDNDIPFSLVRGNHDVGVFGSTEEWRLKKFAQYFDNDTYRSQMSGFYQDSIENSYRLFEVSGVNYLLLNLDYGPSGDVLNWANEIVSAYPKHNVIVVTHAFLFRDGTFLDKDDVYPPSDLYGYNDGDDIWDKFVRKHANISLVLCGHDPEQNIIKSNFVGDNGNQVTCLLIDPQYYDSKCEALGNVAFLHFSNGGSDVSIEYYSTIQNKFFRHCNQLSFSLDVVESLDSSVNKSGGDYQTLVHPEQFIDGKEVIIANSEENKTLHFDNQFISKEIKYIDGSIIFDDDCDTFKIIKVGDEFALEGRDEKYLSFDNDVVTYSLTPSLFTAEFYENNLYLKCGDKYFSYVNNEFTLVDSKTPINLYYYECLSDDYVKETERYITRFMNSFLCGFDDYTPALDSIWNVLRDDYLRLSEEAKQELLNRLASNDATIMAFKERYCTVISKHFNYENFLQIDNIVSQGIARIELFNSFEQHHIFIVILLLSLFFTLIIVLVKKQKTH